MGEMNTNVFQFAYVWIIISIVINMVYVAYDITSSSEYNSYLLSETVLYNAMFGTDQTGSTSINTITNINDEYEIKEENMASQRTSLTETILDELQKLWYYAKWLGFIIQFILLGSMFTALDIWTTNSNIWIKLLFTFTLAIGNIILLIKIAKLVFNSGKQD